MARHHSLDRSGADDWKPAIPSHLSRLLCVTHEHSSSPGSNIKAGDCSDRTPDITLFIWCCSRGSCLRCHRFSQPLFEARKGFSGLAHGPTMNPHGAVVANCRSAIVRAADAEKKILLQLTPGTQLTLITPRGGVGFLVGGVKGAEGKPYEQASGLLGPFRFGAERHDLRPETCGATLQRSGCILLCARPGTTLAGASSLTRALSVEMN